ncbi:aldo/keto reductase [Clostridium sp. CCUG 7971]|uniref:aldo/keto reductase n=1 Tax=Clostridium sp. CCUG 7971 TaxID=2811414 RepID=UPI001ABB50EB|nr:aldo/keto reductase [Clostridium sp. CCUG 7971]MBO3444153.1 aldo/keto reductase [Clostridium sp. CCUG 7971]
MRYRKLGKTNEEVSILGFGCMRFPQIEGKIDEKEATKMVRHAVDNGVNYIDTAYIYHDGESEAFVGRALSEGYREKVKLATKLPTWLVKSREDMDKYLNDQLERLQTSYIDFYLVHNLNVETYETIKGYGLFEFLDKIKKEKLVKHIGFSFHDTIGLYKEIVDDYDWDFTQIQYNYIDEDYQAGTEGLLYAASKNLGVVIMEPLRGGALVNNLSKGIEDIIENSKVKKTPAEWAFKFLYNKEDIGVVLSGMSTMEQVIDNLKIADTQGIENSMTPEEKETLDKLRDEFKSKIKVNCTGCKYCIPCPVNVSIPNCFELLNNASMFDNVSVSKEIYNNILVKEGNDASRCVECGKCEAKCPQHIKIREVLKEVENVFKS